jgi:hypothetical protein
MGVSVKAEWIERYHAEQRQREKEERGRRIERGLLVTYAVTQVAAIGLIYASL